LLPESRETHGAVVTAPHSPNGNIRVFRIYKKNIHLASKLYVSNVLLSRVRTGSRVRERSHRDDLLFEYSRSRKRRRREKRRNGGNRPRTLPAALTACKTARSERTRVLFDRYALFGRFSRNGVYEFTAPPTRARSTTRVPPFFVFFFKPCHRRLLENRLRVASKEPPSFI